MHYLRILLLFLIPFISWSGTYTPILQSMAPGSVTFIGESHKHPESALLINQLIAASTAQHQCLTLGLEINDSQQPIIDNVMNGTASASEINIPAAIDHPAMRELINDYAKLKTQLPCLRLVAIDTGVDTEYDRDEWMAIKLSELPSDKPILVLVGGLHTLKKVDWTVATAKPSVAEILTKRGFRVKSFPQRWLPEKCPENHARLSQFVSADKPEALTILNETFISMINANPYKTATGVIDGFVIWNCANN